MKMNIKILLATFLLINVSYGLENSNVAPIILPGAPGEESKNLDAEDATNIANTSYIEADVKFLQGMIVHHELSLIHI